MHVHIRLSACAASLEGARSSHHRPLTFDTSTTHVVAYYVSTSVEDAGNHECGKENMQERSSLFVNIDERLFIYSDEKQKRPQSSQGANLRRHVSGVECKKQS